MKTTQCLFLLGLRQILRDGMLLVLLPAPFLAGLVLKLGVPLLETLLVARWSFSLVPWYWMIDGFLFCLTPMFMAMICAFLLLEERDDGLCAYYQITPAAGKAYLAARIGIPMVCALVLTLLAGALFSFSSLSWMTLFAGALMSTLTGVFLAMMVVSVAGNRVEGLAVSKLMGISFLGLILVGLVPAPYHYGLALLPSFWIGRLLRGGISVMTLTGGLTVCIFWIVLFTRRFLRRVS